MFQEIIPHGQRNFPGFRDEILSAFNAEASPEPEQDASDPSVDDPTPDQHRFEILGYPPTVPVEETPSPVPAPRSYRHTKTTAGRKNIAHYYSTSSESSTVPLRKHTRRGAASSSKHPRSPRLHSCLCGSGRFDCVFSILRLATHLKKAWEVAQAPFKNLLMMGFMMWMAGNTVHLFSIGITFSALWQPISALQGVGKVFKPYKDSKVEHLGPKLLFIALNLGGLALGVWKLNTLGLLPTHASDWVSSLPPAQEVEYSGGGIPL
ncbi:uncharacterized protein LOC120136344 [Hibiscus syriacus]|uniref:uncharacterized protein LOC120136344 n=1 Tax=Hibiscus syriacus TaxID=106335 RepID=UPI001922B65F|nr:uncharacterized protein LOC120136344 [Hibiscus syriacus]